MQMWCMGGGNEISSKPQLFTETQLRMLPLGDIMRAVVQVKGWEELPLQKPARTTRNLMQSDLERIESAGQEITKRDPSLGMA